MYYKGRIDLLNQYINPYNYEFFGQGIGDARRYEWVRGLALRVGRHGYHRRVRSRDMDA